VNAQISEELKSEIIAVTTSMLASYTESADFWDRAKGKIRQDDYLDFIKLFAGDARVADDIRWTNEMIHYSDYASLVMSHMLDIGLNFELGTVTIESIDIDETGFYVVDLRMVKRLYSGLSKNNKTVDLRSGRKATYDMRIDLPNYLLSDARIQYIKLKTPKKLMEYMTQPLVFINRKLAKN